MTKQYYDKNAKNDLMVNHDPNQGILKGEVLLYC
jgi:hypothetical protein